MRRSFLALFLGALIALVGCGDDGDGTGAAFQELIDQGLTKYVGQFSPANSQEADGVTTHTFAVPSDPLAEPRGPLCLRGTKYTVDTREGSSDALVITTIPTPRSWCSTTRASAWQRKATPPS